MRRRGLPFLLLFSFVWLVFFFITPWALKLLETASYKGKKKKKHKEAEKNPPFLRLDFLSFATYSHLPPFFEPKNTYYHYIASKSLATIYKKIGTEFWVSYFGVQTTIHRLKSMGCCLVMNMLIVNIIVLRFFTFSG